MSAAPFMQLYVADYLGDTQHLTTEQHGAYLLLLMAMWRAGGMLPNDEKKLARIARVSARRWHLVAPDVLDFFDIEGDQITQKRLVEEHQKAVSISEKRSNSGSLGGKAKALKNKDTGLANAKQLLKHSHIPEPYKEKEEPNGSSKSTPRKELETVLDAEHADGVVEHRQRLKKALTVRAARLLAAKFARCPDPNAAADAMISNGWQGFEPEWLERPSPRAASPPPKKTTHASMWTDEAIAYGIIDEPGSTQDRRLDARLSGGRDQGSNHARRIAGS
jgi:uncharacterized protein YdaU (DUF1376 family)